MCHRRGPASRLVDPSPFPLPSSIGDVVLMLTRMASPVAAGSTDGIVRERVDEGCHVAGARCVEDGFKQAVAFSGIDGVVPLFG